MLNKILDLKYAGYFNARVGRTLVHVHSNKILIHDLKKQM